MNIASILALLTMFKAQLATIQNELGALEARQQTAQTCVPVTPAHQPVESPTQPLLGVTPGEIMASIQLDGSGANTLSDGTKVFKTGTVSDAATCIAIFDQDGNQITDASATITTDSLTNTFIPNNGGPFGTSWTAIGSYMYGPITQTNSFSAPNTQCQYVVSTVGTGVHTFATAPGYHFLFAPPSDGSHEITVSALGSTQSITIESTESGQ
jgi:hypothetical protein